MSRKASKVAPTVMVDNAPAKKPEQDQKGRFVSGNIGGGRPKGSRNRLGEAFVQDMYEAWVENGPTVIKAAMERSPGSFIRSMVTILPQEVLVKNELEKLSDDELADIVFALRAGLDAGSAQPSRNGIGVSPAAGPSRSQLN